jgi:hypothetical protein
MPKASRESKFLCIALSLAIATVCALGAFAQSGRQIRKPVAAPTPTPEATPTPPKPVEKAKPLTFIVGMDRTSFSTPLYIYTGVLRSCAQRLGEPETTKVEVADKDMVRSDAIRRAKAETEAYVVWLSIGPDNNSATGNTNETYIEFAVLEPGTAKRVVGGHTYPADYRRSTVILRPSGVNGDRYYDEAARAAADKILSHFHVGAIRP